MVIIGAAFLVPLLWVVLASFDTEASLSVALPGTWSLGNYEAIWNTETTFRPLWNSLLLCGGASVLTMTASVLGAYPRSWSCVAARRALLLTLGFSTGLPITAILIPFCPPVLLVNLTDFLARALLHLGHCG